MFKKCGKVDFGIIIFLLFIAFIIIIYNVKTTVSLLPFILVLVPIIFIIAFTNIDFALFLLIFFMLLSPEFSLGGVRGRDVVLRIDDIFLFVVFLGWLAKMALNKEIGLSKVTPINSSIIVYIFVYVIGTLIGILNGTTRLIASIFYLLKYVEYFMLYFMVVNSLKDKKQIKFFVYAMLAVALGISFYGCFMHLSGAERVTAPFEGEGGEPNTLGGYLMMMMMIATGLILNLPSLKKKIILAAGMCVAFAAFLFTLSRGSWVSFIPAYAVLLFLSRKGKLMLLIVSLLFILLFSVIFPSFVYDRIEATFKDTTPRTIMGREVVVDGSAAARIDTWKDSIKHWSRSPIFGNGAGSAGSVVDNQYMRVLIETGLIGIIAFLLLLFSIYRSCLNVYTQVEDDHFAHGLTAGFLAGYVGLLVHSFGAATFILIRIMEPFWFLTAMVIMLPHLPNEEPIPEPRY
ncbi:MAG: O-antigen ligase family protein [Candidatus Omnitrophota bacterium]